MNVNFPHNLPFNSIKPQFPTSGEPLIDVLNETGLRTGETLSRQAIHRLGKIHRAVHFYLFDKKGNILLQRRSDKVDHYPNMLSISLTGHINAGEGSQSALHREIKEELKIDSSQMKTRFLFSYRQDATLSPTYIDKQFNDVYACFHDFTEKDIVLDKKEVTEIQLIPFSKFQKIIKDKTTLLSQVYGKAYPDLLYFVKQDEES